jgi:hypothetical protein
MTVAVILDVFINIVTILGLILRALRGRIAYEQHRNGRAAFCFAFGLTILRSLLLRWLSGVTRGGILPDDRVRDFLNHPVVFLLLYTGLFLALVWVTWEEFNEYRHNRAQKLKIKAQENDLARKEKELDELKGRRSNRRVAITVRVKPRNP